MYSLKKKLYFRTFVVAAKSSCFSAVNYPQLNGCDDVYKTIHMYPWPES